MRRPSQSGLKLFGLAAALAWLAMPAGGKHNFGGDPAWFSFGPAAVTHTVATHPQNPGTVYAGTGGGVMATTDGGATWRSSGLGGNAVVALAVDRFNPNTLYSAIAFKNYCHHSFRRLFKSTDGGLNWRDVNPPINGCDNIYALVLDPLIANTLYVTDFDDINDTAGPFMKSTDGGASWTAPSYTQPFAALAIDPLDPRTLYAGTFDVEYFGWQGLDTRSGVFKSTDGGVSWGLTGLTKTGVEALLIDPLNPNTLYAAARGFYSDPRGFRGLFKSTDGGANWLPVNNGLAHLLGSVSDREGLIPASRVSLVVDPDSPATLYAGFPGGGGVFKSADGGASWRDFSAGLQNKDVRALALGPGNPNTLYAATAEGLFKVIDPVAAANPIDDAHYFVRQHYLDFLSREPDPSGLAFWTGEIESCGADAACRDVKRVNVSAAFFLSIEFQETGYLAYRAHKAAFGDAASPGVPGTVPAIRRAEFLADAQSLGRGVQVGVGDWQAQLEANKQAYALEFVSRQRFADAFPVTMSAEEFVAELDRRAGGVLSADERAHLVATLAPDPSNVQQRARVLRAVAEDAELRQAEFPRAFVLMQYYGYLRRNPDDAPDKDFGGWRFWLEKLDQFGGNFVQAEMVKAFLDSTEYRQRFGPPGA